MSTKWIDKPTDQKDDYMPVEEPATWTVDVLVGLFNRTGGRFNYELNNSGTIAKISYVNYTLGYNDTKIKVDAVTNAAVMSAHVDKEVVIKST